MLCSATVLFLTFVTLVGTCMYITAGWLALDGTLDLFKQFGPVENRGNPALDPPPQYWINPKTGNYEPINSNNRGNLVPQVFHGIQYYLIALGVFMLFNTVLFLVDSVRSKKVVNDRNYVGKRNSRTCINCTAWLAGYLVFLSVMWLVMAGFGVLPLVEWRITMQRCWDLENPDWSPGTSQGICVDLVQYGLVYFKETQDSGYALICGPGGNYDPPHGDLQGLCDNYYPNFSLYLTSFAGACITLIAMILFAMRHVSNFVYLKIRRWETPPFHPNQSMGAPAAYSMNQVPNEYRHSVANPNYEQNVLLLDQNQVHNDIEMESYDRRSSVDGYVDMKRRYYEAGRQSRSSSFGPDDPVPAYQTHDPYKVDKPRRRHSHESLDAPHHSTRGYESDYSDRRSRRGNRRHRSSSETEDSFGKPPRYHSEGRGSSGAHSRVKSDRRPKPLKSKSRGNRRSDDRQSSRRRSARRDEEFDSLPSDYYFDEDNHSRRASNKRGYRS